MKTLQDYIRQHALTTPDKTAFVVGDQRVSYKQLAQALSEDRGDKQGIGLPGLPGTLPFRRLFGDIILSTTGTTGKPKQVVYTSQMVLANAENLVEAHGYTPDTTFVICGPLNHLGSLSKVWPVMLVGGTVVLLDGLKDMNAFFRAMHTAPHGMATFLVPTAIHQLLQWGSGKLAELASAIDFIETGAAPMPHDDMLRLCQLLPHTRLYNTYASTETGVVCTYNYNDGLCLAGCVGHPTRHAQVKITDDGHIACRGTMAMSGYRNDEAATARTMQDGWVVTADLGELDDEGRLHFKAREGDIINIGGFKIDPLKVEEAARQINGVDDCVCVVSDSPIFGRCLKLQYVSTSGQPLPKPLLARALAARLEAYEVPRLYEQVEHLAMTFNGKKLRTRSTSK